MAARPLPDNITEAAFQDAIVDLAVLTGWLVFHPRPAMVRDGTYVTAIKGHPGYVDLTMVHAGRGLACFVELKSRIGRLSVEQAAWGNAMRAAGLDYRVLRPSDWLPFAEYLMGER